MEAYTDYLMLIAPPQNVRYDIDRYKRASARIIGDFPGLRSPAHISINRMHRCKPFIAQHGLSQMAEKLGHITPRGLQISHFNYFTHGPNAMTIYACIEVDEFTARWFKALNSCMRIIQKPTIPHITIARNIPVDQFKKLWPKFEVARYRSVFVADKLIVLHRETYTPGASWKVYREFQFGSKLMEY